MNGDSKLISLNSSDFADDQVNNSASSSSIVPFNLCSWPEMNLPSFGY